VKIFFLAFAWMVPCPVVQLAAVLFLTWKAWGAK
jgi:hypothetical protein